jgi:hypothetical protein
MTKHRGFRWMLCVGAALLGFFLDSPLAKAQGYRAGDIVGTNFGFVNRYRWTNDTGQVFAPGSVFRLSDFDGKIAFFVFFDVW